MNGKVTAQEISGNPLSGVVFKDLTITDPDGKVILVVDRLEARLSLASIPTFRLDLGTLALENPRVYLDREHPASGMSAGSSNRRKSPPNPPNPKVWWEKSPRIYFGAWIFPTWCCTGASCLLPKTATPATTPTWISRPT